MILTCGKTERPIKCTNTRHNCTSISNAVSQIARKRSGRFGTPYSTVELYLPQLVGCREQSKNLLLSLKLFRSKNVEFETKMFHNQGFLSWRMLEYWKHFWQQMCVSSFSFAIIIIIIGLFRADVIDIVCDVAG